MTTPVLSPSDPDPTTLQGVMDKAIDKEQSQSNNADIKILLPKDFGFIPVPRHLRYDLFTLDFR